MGKLTVIFGIIVGIFLILAPAFVETKNPTAAWIFFPLFGIFFMAFIIFGKFCHKK